MPKISLKNLFLLITIIGFGLCNWFIFRDILTNDSQDMLKIVQYSRYDNLHGLLSVDILSCGLGFLPFAVVETRRLKIHNWYWSVAMIFLAGVGVAIPMFLYLRQIKLDAQKTLV